MEAQRIRAKEEARKLLEELEANEMAAMSSSSDDDESEEDDNDEGEGEQTTKNKKRGEYKIPRGGTVLKLAPCPARMTRRLTPLSALSAGSSSARCV